MDDQVFEFRWKDERTPYLRILRHGVLMEKILAFDLNISLEITGGISCSGYEKNGEYHPCINGGVSGVRTCEICKKQAGMPIAQYCDGFNTAMFSGAEIDTLSTPHYLYFALFERDLIKVGVSSSGRGYMRQIEQGTHCACIVAEGMWGVPARQMETLFRKSGIVDKVQGSQKKNIFFPEISLPEAEQNLSHLVEKYLPSVLTAQPELEQYCQNPLKFLSFDTEYHLQKGRSITKPLEIIDLFEGESLSGTLLSVKGSFLLIETDDGRFLVNAKKLKGHTIDFSAKPIGLQKQDAFQGSLF